MKLNCKPGDLAVLVRSKFGNCGAIVQCVELLIDRSAVHSWGVRCSRPLNRPGWSAKDYEWCKSRGFDELVWDSLLRPIRDSDGEDEMLRIAGKPQERELVK